MSLIMVVDDSSIIREPIAEALRFSGFEVMSVASGNDAVELLQQRRPDLILMDMCMPGMNGVALLEVIRADQATSSIPVIMLSGSSSKDAIVQVGKLGVRDYFLKLEFSWPALLERIRARLAGGEQPITPVVPSSLRTVVHSGRDGSGSSLSAPLPELVEGLQDVEPLVSKAEMAELLKSCGELKGLAPVVAQVLEMTNNPRCAIENVARLIKQDHAISLKILKLANSVVYTRGEPVDSVQKAVMRIGMTQIRQAVLNISVIERFSKHGSGDHLEATEFWEHSIACGLIAAVITRARNGTDAQIDAAFTMGLLHDVGRMVYVEMLGERYLRVLEAAERLQLPLEQVETRMLLVNHADAMESVLRAWRFPKDIVNPIALHHVSAKNIRHVALQSSTDACTVAVANRLAHAMMLSASGNSSIYPISEFVEVLKLESQVLRQIEETIPDRTNEIRLVMLSSSNRSPEVCVKEQVRRRLPPTFNPLAVTIRPREDPYRILCDHSRRAGADEPPTLGVVHIGNSTERAELESILKSAESRFACPTPLPLIVLSPKGNIALDGQVMATRPFQLLPSTVTLRRFLNASETLFARRVAA